MAAKIITAPPAISLFRRFCMGLSWSDVGLPDDEQELVLAEHVD
jgi:hypothetical protein